MRVLEDKYRAYFVADDARSAALEALLPPPPTRPPHAPRGGAPDEFRGGRGRGEGRGKGKGKGKGGKGKGGRGNPSPPDDKFVNDRPIRQYRDLNVAR